MEPDSTDRLILFAFLAVLLAGGVWIAIALLATGWVGMQFAGGSIPAGTRARDHGLGQQRLVVAGGVAAVHLDGRDPVPHAAVGGDVPRLLALANWLPGRLMHVNVLACGVFGSVSGSSAATCATVAKIALPELKKRGYDEKMALGSLAGAGTLGILIPPSITMVVYAVQANVSIIQVFLAGFLPGLLVMVLYSGYIVVWSLLHPERTPPADPPMPLREKLHGIAQSHSRACC